MDVFSIIHTILKIANGKEGGHMKKLGSITIGQAPREDVMVDLLPILGDGFEVCQAGALDGLTAEEIEAFRPEEGDHVLISKLRDGSSVVFAERHILPRLQRCIHDLEAEGVEAILFLCTGQFPEFQHSVPLVFPCEVLNGVVPALANRSRIAAITPKPEQREQCEQKWKGSVSSVQVAVASPYGDPEELDRAAQEVSAMDVDLVVLDCIGYTRAMKEQVRRVSGKRVILSRTLAARAVLELLD